MHSIGNAKDGFEPKAFLACGFLIECFGALTGAADGQNVRQGKAIFVEVNYELGWGHCEVDRRHIGHREILGIVGVLQEFEEESEGVVVKLARNASRELASREAGASPWNIILRFGELGENLA